MTYTTILVLTHNRPKMMKRFLDYMYQEKVIHKILIADSSDDMNCELEMSKLVEKMSEVLNISYSHFIGNTPHEKYLLALDLVDTPFVCTLADHNFVNIACLIECESFLSENVDYSHVNGRIYITSNEHNQIKFRVYPQMQSGAVNLIDRVVYHLEVYTNNFYTVCRVSSLARLHLAFNANIGRSLKERLATIVLLANGKRMVLDCDFLVRDKVLKKTGVDETGNRTVEGNPEDSSYIEDISFGFDEYVRLAKSLIQDGSLTGENDMAKLERALIKQHKNWKHDKFRGTKFWKTIVSVLPHPLRHSIAFIRHYAATHRSHESGVVDESRSPFLSKIRSYLAQSFVE